VHIVIVVPGPAARPGTVSEISEMTWPAECTLECALSAGRMWHTGRRNVCIRLGRATDYLRIVTDDQLRIAIDDKLRAVRDGKPRIATGD